MARLPTRPELYTPDRDVVPFIALSTAVGQANDTGKPVLVRLGAHGVMAAGTSHAGQTAERNDGEPPLFSFVERTGGGPHGKQRPPKVPPTVEILVRPGSNARDLYTLYLEATHCKTSAACRKFIHAIKSALPSNTQVSREQEEGEGCYIIRLSSGTKRDADAVAHSIGKAIEGLEGADTVEFTPINAKELRITLSDHRSIAALAFGVLAEGNAIRR